MKTEVIDLKRISINENNPRTITEVKFDQLIDSILSFPKMLIIRPIAVNGAYVAQGGNMRFRSLTTISQMSIDEIKTRLEAQQSFQEKTNVEQKQLIDYWAKWLKKPIVEIVMADDLTEAELKEFTIKDNVSFGEWNHDMLANEWDESQLNEWGMDLWEPDAEPEPEEPEPEKDEVVLKLTYSESEYNKVIAALAAIGSTPEQAIKQLLNI